MTATLPTLRVREHIEAGRLMQLDELTLSLTDTLDTTLGEALAVAALMSQARAESEL